PLKLKMDKSNNAPLCSRIYPYYVLLILMLVYLTNQLDRYVLVPTNIAMSNDLKYGDRICEATNGTSTKIWLANHAINSTADNYCKNNEHLCDEQTKSNWNETLCSWYYLGTGIEYQLLAGPLFIILFSLSGVPLGVIAEVSSANRKNLLTLIIFLWSCMTILSGLAQTYWHVALTRLLIGVFQAGCTPFSASIISDYFSSTQRGFALGFYNWGIYIGYSMSFLMNITTRLVGWRPVYIIAGAPGIVISIVVFFTVKEPERHGMTAASKLEDTAQDKSSANVDQSVAMASNASKFKEALRTFTNPVLLFLCLGGAIRNGGGYVWSYNINNFFTYYHPGTRVEMYMSWIPIVFGAIGAIGGGYISDKLLRQRGLSARLLVLICSQILAAPFQVGTLFLDPPWAFISQIPAYIFGEMWIGVCLAVVVDLVPYNLRASAVALYVFIISAIGGNMNIFVSPISEVLDLRIALLITFPGLYVLGAAFFLLTLIIMKVCKKRLPNHDDLDEYTPLLQEKKYRNGSVRRA
ncbi:unnamed protein product, partial [Owenia fusiformis]